MICLFLGDVRQTGTDTSRWVVTGPAGVPVEWTAVVTKYEPNRLIGWKTIAGWPVAHAGLVRFDSNSDGTTRIDLRLSYNPVAGALGRLVASLFGADPKSEIDADLLRMKTMIKDAVSRLETTPPQSSRIHRVCPLLNCNWWTHKS